MDDRVMVEVYIPAAMLRMEAVLPSAFRIAQIKKQLLPMLQECTSGAFIAREACEFYLCRLQLHLLDDQLVKEIGIYDGDEIVIW